MTEEVVTHLVTLVSVEAWGPQSNRHQDLIYNLYESEATVTLATWMEKQPRAPDLQETAEIV